MTELRRINNKTAKKQDTKKASSSLNNQSSSRKQLRKSENPSRLPIDTHTFSDFGHSNSWICKNSACKAVLSIDDTFCKRCSCCICHLYDDNKDPSLWLVCTTESGEGDSCGLSCHIECAIQREKVGVVDLGQLMQLDGSYCCASCGKVTGILGYVMFQHFSFQTTFIIFFTSEVIFSHKLMTQKATLNEPMLVDMTGGTIKVSILQLFCNFWY